MMDELEKLFWDHNENFGLSDVDFPEERPQDDQVDFEEKFKEILCRYKGHKLIPDQCGMVTHDYCCVCGSRREEINDGVVTNCHGEITKEGLKTTSFISDDFRGND